MRRLLVFVPMVFLVACNADNPCGPPAGYADLSGGAELALDVTGVSNADCTLTVSRGSTSVIVQIAAPSPPVADVPFDGNIYFDRFCNSDAGATVSVTPSQLASATRNPTRACVTLSPDAMVVLGFSKPVDDCQVSISLTCGGVTQYDHRYEELCQIMC